MKSPLYLTAVFAVAAATNVMAYPPAPHHTIQGIVRNAQGTPLSSSSALLILIGPDGEAARTLVDPDIAPGINYRLHVPQDSNKSGTLYRPTAMVTSMPFTIRVEMGGGAVFLPIEFQGGTKPLGVPAGTTRLDLTIGIDSDGDGLPDAWEQNLLGRNGLDSLDDIDPDGDADGDGMSNRAEYLAGTDALDPLSNLSFEFVDVGNETARLRFTGVIGRTYSLSASGNARNWALQPFLLAPSSPGSPPADNGGLYFRATRVAPVEIEVPIKDKSRTLLKLHVD